MRVIFAIIVVGATMLGGCSGAGNNGNGNRPNNTNNNRPPTLKAPPPIKPAEAVDLHFKSCNPYYPLVPGSIAKYVINYPTGTVADRTVVVDATEEDGRKIFVERTQIVDRSGGMYIIQSAEGRYVCDDGNVRVLTEKFDSVIGGENQSSVDFNYRQNSLMMADPETISRKGATWRQAFRQVSHTPGQPPTVGDEPTIIVFEVSGPEEVTTAAGTFKAVKITRKIRDGYTIDYYVPGLGLVRRTSKEGASWELREYSGLKALD
jgi:hypothetical protein